VGPHRVCCQAWPTYVARHGLCLSYRPAYVGRDGLCFSYRPETEENSIRPLDPKKGLADAPAFGGGGPEPAKRIDVEVTDDPSGDVIKGDG
jgi:hypothetical protein